MSAEISISASLSATKDGFSDAASGSVSLDMSATAIVRLKQSIATSSTAINLGTIAGAPKALYVKNLDATNYVEIDNITGFTNWPQKLLPGQMVLLSPQTKTLFLKANTAACLVELCAGDA